MNLRAFVFHPQIDADERPEKRKMLESVEFNFKKSHYLWLKGFSMSEDTAVNNLVNFIEEKKIQLCTFLVSHRDCFSRNECHCLSCLTLFEAIYSFISRYVLKFYCNIFYSRWTNDICARVVWGAISLKVSSHCGLSPLRPVQGRWKWKMLSL